MSQKQSPEDPEKCSCFALFAKFGKEVIFTWFIQYYHGLFKTECMVKKNPSDNKWCNYLKIGLLNPFQDLMIKKY